MKKSGGKERKGVKKKEPPDETTKVTSFLEKLPRFSPSLSTRVNSSTDRIIYFGICFNRSVFLRLAKKKKKTDLFSIPFLLGICILSFVENADFTPNTFLLYSVVNKNNTV